MTMTKTLQHFRLRLESIAHIALLAVLALSTASLNLLPAQSLTEYGGTWNNQSSVYVPASTHGITSGNLGVVLFVKCGSVYLAHTCNGCWTADSSNNVTITIPSDVSSGSGQYSITGPWPGYTTVSTDFGLGRNEAHTKLYVCPDCSASTPAVRWDNNTGILSGMANPSTFTWSGSPSTASTVYVYLDGGILFYGVPATTYDSTMVTTNSAVMLGMTAMPSSPSVTPIGSLSITSGVFGSPSDSRVADFTCTSSPCPSVGSISSGTQTQPVIAHGPTFPPCPWEPSCICSWEGCI